MFKASIALVIFAFGALIYGWVQGIDSLLYGSIAFSALAGVALLRSTMVERKKFASARKAVKKEAEEQVHSGRATLAELSARARTEAAAAEDPYRRTRTPIKPFGDSAPSPAAYPQDEFGPDVEGEDLIQRTLNWVDASDEEEDFEEPTVPRGRPQSPPRSRPAPTPRERSQSTVRRIEPERRVEPARRVQPRRPVAPSPAEDFRARLASVLGDPDPPPPLPPPPASYEDDPREEVQQEWIRIEDVPRIARATRTDGGYARPELPSVQPPKRRTTPTPKSAATPRNPAVKPEPATPRRRTTGPPKAPGAKAVPAKGPATRTRAPSAKPPATTPTADVADKPAPRGRPRAQP